MGVRFFVVGQHERSRVGLSQSESADFMNGADPEKLSRHFLVMTNVENVQLECVGSCTILIVKRSIVNMWAIDNE